MPRGRLRPGARQVTGGGACTARPRPPRLSATQRSASATSRAASTTLGPTRSGTASASITTPTLPSTPVTPSREPPRRSLRPPTRRVSGCIRVRRRPGAGRRGSRGRPLPVQGVAEAGAVGHVVVGPGRFDHGDGEGVRAVDQGEVSGRPDVLGQRAQRGSAASRTRGCTWRPSRSTPSPTRARPPRSRRTRACCSRVASNRYTTVRLTPSLLDSSVTVSPWSVSASSLRTRSPRSSVWEVSAVTTPTP